MKRLLILLSVLVSGAALAQSPGVGLDSFPSANPLSGGELLFGYQAGTGGSGALACARGWCPVSVTPNQLKTFIGSGGGSSAFGSLTSGTNTSAAMIVGSGASLSPTGSGTLNANQVNGASVPSSAAVLATNSSSQPVAASTTGTGSVVLANSPALVTPNLGTPSALVLTNATGLPNASVIGLGTLATANAVSPPALGGTTPNSGAFTTLTTNISTEAGAQQVGYLGIPLTGGSTKTTSYGFVLGDQGTMAQFNCVSSCTVTVPANASVAFAVDTVINIHNLCTATTNLNIAITSDTMYLHNTPTATAPFVLAPCGVASIYKENTTAWVIVGDAT